jgi:hypothetical protein
MIYQILKIGADVNERFLSVTMSGDDWTSQTYGYRFLSLVDANNKLNSLKSDGIECYMIYVNNLWRVNGLPSWGEVNRDALGVMNQNFAFTAGREVHSC